MDTKLRSLACVTALCLTLGLSGCASTPPACPAPPLPADLAAPLPPEGWFTEQLTLILQCGRDPTSDPRCSDLLGEPTK